MKQTNTPVSASATELDIMRQRAQAMANTFGKPYSIAVLADSTMTVLGKPALDTLMSRPQGKPLVAETFQPQCVIAGVDLAGYGKPVTIELPTPAVAPAKNPDDEIPF
jgi:hypothetical protein